MNSKDDNRIHPDQSGAFVAREGRCRLMMSLGEVDVAYEREAKHLFLLLFSSVVNISTVVELQHR